MSTARGEEEEEERQDRQTDTEGERETETDRQRRRERCFKRLLSSAYKATRQGQNVSETERERQTDKDRQTETDRDRDALTFYCLQLTSPQDKDRDRQTDRQTDREAGPRLVLTLQRLALITVLISCCCSSVYHCATLCRPCLELSSGAFLVSFDDGCAI